MVSPSLLAAQMHMSPEEFCRQVVAGVSEQIAREVVSKVLSYEIKTLPDWGQEHTAAALLTHALDVSQCTALECQLTLKHPIVAIGAPVEAYLPRTAEQMHTELIIPQYAHVANAVGAIAGGVVLRMRVLVQYFEDQERAFFRAYLPDGTHDFGDLEQAVNEMQRLIVPYLEERTQEAGADHVEVMMNRRDQRVPTGPGAVDDLCLGTELHFTATGRPGLAQ